MHINGLYRHGFLIAPAIIDSVVKILTNQDTTLANTFEIELHEEGYEHIC